MFTKILFNLTQGEQKKEKKKIVSKYSRAKYVKMRLDVGMQ